jgi:hypothetical protein
MTCESMMNRHSVALPSTTVTNAAPSNSNPVSLPGNVPDMTKRTATSSVLWRCFFTMSSNTLMDRSGMRERQKATLSANCAGLFAQLGRFQHRSSRFQRLYCPPISAHILAVSQHPAGYRRGTIAW